MTPRHPREPDIDTLANVMAGCFLVAVIAVVLAVVMIVIGVLV